MIVAEWFWGDIDYDNDDSDDNVYDNDDDGNDDNEDDDGIKGDRRPD